MRKILIVGGTGFVGSSLLGVLQSSKQDSVTITASGLKPDSNRLMGNNHYKIARWNILEECELDPNFDLIIHAATPASAQLNSEDPNQMYNVIVKGMENVINFLSRHRSLPTVLFTSSGAVYGSNSNLTTNIGEDSTVEFDTQEQRSAYADGKREAELMLIDASNRGICKGIIARLFAFSGSHLPRDRHFAIGNFVDDAVLRKKIVIRSDGSSIRSYLDERDLANWLLTIAERGVPENIYHVGSERAISIRDLAYLISERYELLSGNKTPVEILGKSSRIDGVSHYVPSTARTRTELGLSETISLESSVDIMLQTTMAECI